MSRLAPNSFLAQFEIISAPIFVWVVLKNISWLLTLNLKKVVERPLHRMSAAGEDTWKSKILNEISRKNWCNSQISGVFCIYLDFLPGILN